MGSLYVLTVTCVSLVCAYQSSFSSNQYAGVIFDIKTSFYTDCLFLVYRNSLKLNYVELETVKLLSELDVLTSFLAPSALNETVETFKCKIHRPLYVLGASPETKSYVKMVRKLPSYPRWLIFLDDSQSIEDFFIDIFVPFNCELLVAQNFGSNIHLTEIYQVAEDTPLRSRSFGSWSSEAGLSATKVPLLNRRCDLDGLVLKAINLEGLYSVSGYSSDLTERMQEKAYLIIWKYLESQLNFKTVDVSEDHVKDSGKILKNGLYNDMITLVENNDIDVATNGFVYQKERTEVVDFLMPIKQSKVDLIVRKPSQGSFQWTSFLAPFAKHLWLGVVGSMFLCSVLLTLTYQIQGIRDLEELGESEDLLSSLFHVFGLYCSQGTSLKPSAASTRTVLLLAGLTATVLLAAYAGSLTSVIAVQKYDLPHETIQEFVDDPEYQVEISLNGFWLYVNNSRGELFRRLHKLLSHRIDEMPATRLDGVQKLCKSKKPYAWISSRNFGDNFLDGLDCEIVSVPGYVAIDAKSFIVPKGSPYKQLLDHRLLAMREAGVLRQIFQLASPRVLVNGNTPRNCMEFYQFVPILTILVFGTALGIVIMIAEFLQRRSTSSNANCMNV